LSESPRLQQNAGTDSSNPPIDELPIEEFDKVFSVNVRGALLMTQAAVAAFKAQSPQGGRIISTYS
jgi:NAD(P)-dependent dehydrogenase (short-subunit alcohol dehydrogenase family)